MKHAGADALDRLGRLIADLRARPPLRETRPGIFYLKGRAFLHFHEDRDGLFADLREGGDWLRLPVDGADDRAALLDRVDGALRQRGIACRNDPDQIRRTRLGPG